MSWNTTAVTIFNAAFTLVGGFVAHRLNLGRERRQALREFRMKLGELRSKFERQPDDGLVELHHKCVPVIQGHVAALKQDIVCGYGRLRTATDVFCGIQKNEIRKEVGPMALAVEYQTGRKTILEALDGIENAL
jgi:hypothetical protein